MLRRSLSLISVALMGWPSLPAQQPPRFTATSNMVIVDVRVVDSAGRPVRGLTAEDFSLSEEGVTQAISYFREVSIPLPNAVEGAPGEQQPPVMPAEQPPQEAAAPTRAASPADTGAAGPATPEKRSFILFFNLSAMDPQDAHFVREAARKFLETGFTPNDEAAVAVFDQSLSLLSNMTSDRDELLAAVNRLGQVSPEIDSSDESSASASGEFLADQTEFSLFETNEQLYSLQSLTEAFGDLPGRKSILYFTPGLTADAIENTEQMRLTTDDANRHNTSFYTVDSRGLVAPSPGGGAHRSGGGGTSIFNGRASLGQLSSLATSQEGLTTLAADTGGAALLDDNDLQKIFTIAQEEASHYYLLGYRISEIPRDGRFHRIEVRTRRSGVRLTFRKGYYADKPYTALTSVEREQQLQQAIVDEIPSDDFNLEMASEYFPRAADRFQVSVILSFDFAELEQLSESENLNLEIVILARQPDGEVLAGVRDQVEIKPNRNSGEPRFLYQNVLDLPAGSYELTAYVRDNRRGHLSSGRTSLSIPPGDGRLLFGSLVLAQGTQPVGTSSGFSIKTGRLTTVLSNPLEIAGQLMIPRLPAVFRPRDTLYFHCKLLALEAPPPTQFRIALLAEDGKRLVSGPWLGLRPSADDPRGLECSGKTPLAGLSPGRYSLVVEVEAAEGVKSVMQAFEIASPPVMGRPGNHDTGS